MFLFSIYIYTGGILQAKFSDNIGFGFEFQVLVLLLACKCIGVSHLLDTQEPVLIHGIALFTSVNLYNSSYIMTAHIVHTCTYVPAILPNIIVAALAN